MRNKITVIGWQPIDEYDTKRRPWVLVKCYDEENHCFVTEYAVLLSDNKWYGVDSELLFEPKYFFDVDQI